MTLLRPTRPRLTGGAAFLALALTFAVVMLGATLPTPMYPTYQRELGFSPLVQTVIFAVYAAGVLAALLAFGRWSDTLGRRPLLLGGLGCALASSVVFLLAGPVWVLLVGRLLSGLSAGIFAGAATAAVVEAAPQGWKDRASAVATAANIGGLGLGPLLGGVAVQYLPAPLHLSYAVHVVAVLLGVAAVLAVPETVDVAPGARPQRQHLAVPAEVRGVFVGAATAGFAGFAVLGLFTAISPKIDAEVLGQPNVAVTGVVIFLLLGSSVVAQVVLRGLSTEHALDLGCALLAGGLLLLALAVALASTPLFALGAVVAGAGQGLSFSKGLASVNAKVDPGSRGGITSTYFVVVYVAISLPVVGVGAALGPLGLVTTSIVFLLLVAALAVAALVALRVQRSRQAPREGLGRGRSLHGA